MYAVLKRLLLGRPLRSAEQEHREILEAALRRPTRRSLAAVLASIPNVGRDADFVRRNPIVNPEQRSRRRIPILSRQGSTPARHAPKLLL